jgi:hypothetical protein
MSAMVRVTAPDAGTRICAMVHEKPSIGLGFAVVRGCVKPLGRGIKVGAVLISTTCMALNAFC